MFLLICLAAGCRSRTIPVDNLQAPRVISAAEEKFAGVYKMLDGDWQGIFYIYEDPDYLASNGADRNIPADFSPAENGLIAVDSINVRQSYRSQSPYYQTVRIRDVYQTDNETEREVTSIGVNKVQQGALWCVVQKPDEVVVHQGQLLDEKTIIWSRHKENPQRIEWFRETVTDSSYSIIGWGYYEGDDPRFGPPLWFTAKYVKQKGTEINE